MDLGFATYVAFRNESDAGRDGKLGVRKSNHHTAHHSKGQKSDSHDCN